MFGIFLSAINVALGFIFRSVLVKFVTFFALFFVVEGFMSVLVSSGLLPDPQKLQGAFYGIPAGVWYFLDLFGLSTGLPAVLAAFLARFIIRRIPLIG